MKLASETELNPEDEEMEKEPEEEVVEDWAILTPGNFSFDSFYFISKEFFAASNFKVE